MFIYNITIKLKLITLKNFLPYFLLFLLVFLLSFLWEYIRIPFDSSINIHGEDYTSNSHSPLNDSIRFVLFIFLPLGGYFFYKLFLNKFSLLFFLNQFSFKEEEKKPNNTEYNNDLFLYSLLLIFLVLLQFLSLDFKNYISNIDMFHEGLWLTASSNAIYTNKFWESSYIGRGLFGNFYNFFVWKITSINSIGFSRLIPLLLTFCNKILLIFIAKSLVEKCHLNKIEKNLFFVILSILLINLFSYDITAGSYYRLFILLIFVFFLLNFFDNLKSKSFSFLCIGLLSSSSLFWFIDIGIFINFIIIIFGIFLILNKLYSNFFYLFFYIILGWFFWFILLPEKEFISFYDNTINILKSIEYIGGLIYPTPFFSKDARSTRALLLILVTGIFIINFLFKKKHNASFNLKLSLIFLFIASCVSFKIALGRSDTVHIKAGLILIHIPFYYFLIMYFIEILNKNKFFKNINLSTKYLTILIFLVLTIFSYTKDRNIKFKNIPNFVNSINLLIHANDFAFLNQEYKDFINYYKKLILNEECVQIFTNENAIPYFLKKPTCSKFYVIYTLQPENLQKEFVKDISIKKPNYIIYESSIDSYNNSKSGLDIANKYILDEYTLFKIFNKWKIYRINKKI